MYPKQVVMGLAWESKAVYICNLAQLIFYSFFKLIFSYLFALSFKGL